MLLGSGLEPRLRTLPRLSIYKSLIGRERTSHRSLSSGRRLTREATCRESKEKAVAGRACGQADSVGGPGTHGATLEGLDAGGRRVGGAVQAQLDCTGCDREHVPAVRGAKEVVDAVPVQSDGTSCK